MTENRLPWFLKKQLELKLESKHTLILKYYKTVKMQFLIYVQKTCCLITWKFKPEKKIESVQLIKTKQSNPVSEDNHDQTLFVTVRKKNFARKKKV